MSTKKVIDYHQPCYKCIMYPVVLSTMMCGIFPINFGCATQNSECTFKLSKIWLFHSILDCSVIFFLIAATFYGYIESGLISENKDDLTQIVAFAIDVMNQISSISIIIMNLNNYHLFVKSFRDISSLMHSPKSQLINAFPKHVRKEIYNHGLIRCCMICLVFIIQSFISITAIFRENLVPIWFFVLKSFDSTLAWVILYICLFVYNLHQIC